MPLLDALALLFTIPMCDGEAMDRGGVGSGGGCCIEETLGGFDPIIGPFDVRLGEGLGTGTIDEETMESVGVGGIFPDLTLLFMPPNMDPAKGDGA